MAGGKLHNLGGKKGHNAKERRALLGHLEKRNQQLLNQFWRRQRKKNKNTVLAVRAVASPEVLRQWARYQQLVARGQLAKGKILPVTFYSKLLAIDALFSKNLPAKRIKVGRKSFALARKPFLGETERKGIFEKFCETGADKGERNRVLAKQMQVMQKTLPKTIKK